MLYGIEKNPYFDINDTNGVVYVKSSESIDREKASQIRATVGHTIFIDFWGKIPIFLYLCHYGII